MSEELNWWQRHSLWFKKLGRFHEFEGSLLRAEGPYFVVRTAQAYSWHHRHIKSGRDLRACLRAGFVVWPGCYDIRYVTHNGDVICSQCVLDQFAEYIADIRSKSDDRIVGLNHSGEVDPSHIWACDFCGENMWDEADIPKESDD